MQIFENNFPFVILEKNLVKNFIQHEKRLYAFPGNEPNQSELNVLIVKEHAFSVSLSRALL